MKFNKKTYGLMLSLVLFVTLALSSFSVFAETVQVINEEEQITLATSIDPNEVKYKVNKNLNPEQIQKRFIKINSRYKINEPFSPEDTEFVRTYAQSASKASETPIEINSLKSESFNKSLTKFGVGVRFTGTLYSEINILNHWYRGNVKAEITEGSSKVSEIELTVTNVAYGLLGASGTYVGIVYDGSTSSSTTTNKTQWSMDRTVEYGGIAVLYTYTNAYTTITTPSGSFNLYGF